MGCCGGSGGKPSGGSEAGMGNAGPHESDGRKAGWVQIAAVVLIIALLMGLLIRL